MAEILRANGRGRRWHLGKNVGSPLLKVTWTTEDGTEDSIALQVADLDAWLKALDGPPEA